MMTSRELFIFLNGFGAGSVFGISTFCKETNIELPEEIKEGISYNLSQVVLLALHEHYPEIYLRNPSQEMKDTLAQLKKEKLYELITIAYESFVRAGPNST